MSIKFLLVGSGFWLASTGVQFSKRSTEVRKEEKMDQQELWCTMMDALNGPLENQRALRAHATLTQPVVLQKWNGQGQEDTLVPLKAGTRVNVVMASRFGDVGITDDLHAEGGYDFRIQCVVNDGERSPKTILTDIEILPEDPPGRGRTKEKRVSVSQTEINGDKVWIFGKSDG
jgi:hypothetical protein